MDDGGLSAIVRADPVTESERFRCLRIAVMLTWNTGPPSTIAALLWFTGQSGIYGRLDPAAWEGRSIQFPAG